MAGKDALAVSRGAVVDARAAAIGRLQKQFNGLQAELLSELRQAVSAVEAAEHVTVHPLEAEIDALDRRITDIDRLTELAQLKIRVEPQHRFVEYARLLHQVSPPPRIATATALLSAALPKGCQPMPRWADAALAATAY